MNLALACAFYEGYMKSNEPWRKYKTHAILDVLIFQRNLHLEKNTCFSDAGVPLTHFKTTNPLSWISRNPSTAFMRSLLLAKRPSVRAFFMFENR